MNKGNIIGIRFDDTSLEFIKEEAKKANDTMSNWIREQIKPRNKR